MLEIEDLHKSYGPVRALAGVSLSIPAGDVVALLGHNGAGKTTLVSIVAGLRRPDSGRVEVAGIDVTRRPYDARLHIGLAPQDLGVYPVVTAKDNLTYFGRLAGIGKRELTERIDAVATALRMTSFIDRPASRLSGGERRRLHTAVALLHRPSLLLLDEPTTGADVGTRAALLEVVRDLARQGTAVCYSTHYLGEVEQLGAEVAILEQGSLIARGPLAELIATHAEPVVEMTFEGPAPRLPFEEAFVSDSTVRITTKDPAASAAAALTALGAEAQRLRSIEIVQPSLESVYLSLTGRRFEMEKGQDQEKEAVPA